MHAYCLEIIIKQNILVLVYFIQDFVDINNIDNEQLRDTPCLIVCGRLNI